MANPHERPAHRFAKNLRILLALQGKTVAEVAKAAGVEPKQVYNILNVSHDFRVKSLEKVAQVFGLSTWQMLAVDFEDEPTRNTQVLALLECFSRADAVGRRTIMQVAEIASAKTPEPPRA